MCNRNCHHSMICLFGTRAKEIQEFRENLILMVCNQENVSIFWDEQSECLTNFENMETDTFFDFLHPRPTHVSLTSSRSVESRDVWVRVGAVGGWVGGWVHGMAWEGNRETG